MINAATLYPFLTLFLPEPRRQAILHRARGSTGNGLKTSIGLVAQGFGASAALRCCPHCMRRSLDHTGDVPWLRLHQLPGVSVCAIHRCWLIELPRQSAQGNRHRLLQPCDAHSVRSMDGPVHDQAIRFAAMSQDLLQAASSGVRCSGYADVYRLGLREAGMARGREQIDWPALRTVLQAGVAGWAGFPHLTRLALAGSQVPAWIRTALGGRDSAVHPICHIALIDALFGSVASFITCIEQRDHPPKNIGQAPVDPRWSEADVLKDTALSCRQAAACLGLSVTTVSLRRRQLGVPIRLRGDVLPGEAEPLLFALAAGAAVAEVARQHRWSVSAVYRLLACHPLIRTRRASGMASKRRAAYRQSWQQARRNSPDADLSALRALAPAIYTWLRRNDAQWLDAHLPQRRPVNAKPRVDWAQRDLRLALLVPATAASLRSWVPPVRATAGAILRQLYPTGSWQHHRGRLPKLEKALADHSEPLDAFRDRKRGWLDQQVAASPGKTLQDSLVLRMTSSSP